MLQERLAKLRNRSAARDLQALVDAAAALVNSCKRDSPEREFDVVAQVCRLLAPRLSSRARQWVVNQMPDACRERVLGSNAPDPTLAAAAKPLLTLPDLDPLADFYEQFLQAHNPRARKARGAFYTPPPIARYIVRGIDRWLREDFGLPSGLLETIDWEAAAQRGLVAQIPSAIRADSPLVRILDPALGAGMFLTELVLHARRQVQHDDGWNDAVAALLPRICAVEIVPPAALIAVVRIALTLADTGYRFSSQAAIDLRIGDALAAPLRPACTVVLGNPPFSGISAAKHDWLDALLRGRGPAGEPRASYFDFAGAPLGERKHWLQDDYVKFLRIAHEQIETTGIGIIGLVTNHGYLDNLTFRGLREKLAQTFDRVSILDMHGNSKRRERSPDGSRDENVFAIEQGVAIGLFRRLPGPRVVERGDLWGSRVSKLAAIDEEPTRIEMTQLAAWQPGQAFHVASSSTFAEYEAGWPLDKAMPVNSTAPVTARDQFVIAMTREELIQRCEIFCDPTISDDEIRERYFQRTRSRQYAAGDTRGWKLPQARARLRDTDWLQSIRPVLYRPFDWRYILWSDGMIDWPRAEVTSHLLRGTNLALITRRQSPAGQPWNFAWITDDLTVDGVIRSDNRGSESVFPLWLNINSERRANFDPRFLDEFDAALRRKCEPTETFHFIYALLHASVYRERYASSLTRDFPRIPFPASQRVFEALARLGAELAASHLLVSKLRSHSFIGELPVTVAPGYPRYQVGRLMLNPSAYFDEISYEVAGFFVGSHRVAIKLFKDRRARMLETSEMERLARSLAAIEESLAVTRQIDEVDFSAMIPSS